MYINLLIVTMAYFLGSVPFALIISKLQKGIDIREYGSKNIGATNALRILGKKAAIMTLTGDLLKGLCAVLLAKYIIGQEKWIVAAGLMAIIGHIFPVYLGFRGGKGVATSFGVFLGLIWQIALIALLVWITAAVIWRYSSVAALSATISLPVVIYLTGQPNVYLTFSIAVAILIFFRHKKNIANLINGTEKEIGEKRN